MDVSPRPARFAAALLLCGALVSIGQGAEPAPQAAPAIDDFDRLRAERTKRELADAQARMEEVMAANRARRAAEDAHEKEYAQQQHRGGIVRCVTRMTDTERAGLGLPPLPDYRAPRNLPRKERAAATRLLWEHWLAELSAAQRTALDARVAAYLRAEAQTEAKTKFGEQKLPSPTDGYTWEGTADELELGATTVARLCENGFAIEPPSWKQSFEVYTGSALPVFITTDSWLNGFHVLFEDSFRELELRRVVPLRRFLEDWLDRTRATARRAGPAYDGADRQVQIVLGTALQLLGTPPKACAPEWRTEIDRQVAFVRSAQVEELPTWLGEPNPRLLALDYRLCRPVGFYADGNYLPDYFRAVRWLQMVPFRADHDDELLALLLLRSSLEHAASREAEILRADETWRGTGDQPSVWDFSSRALTQNHGDSASGYLSAVRESLAEVKNLGDGDCTALPDHRRLPPTAPRDLSELQFRILPGGRLPDAVLLQQVGDRGGAPSGLQVAAWLGAKIGVTPDTVSPPARSRAPNADSERSSRSNACIYDQYIEILRALNDAPDGAAPPLFSSTAWNVKTTQTTLASWAQMRHAFTLQAKESRLYLGITDKPPGFVEPTPEFFRRASELCRRISGQLEREGAFTPCSLEDAELLRNLAERVRAMPPYEFDSYGLFKAARPHDEQTEFDTRVAQEIEAFARAQGIDLDSIGATQVEPFRARLLAALQSSIDAAERGVPTEERLKLKNPIKTNKSLRQRWVTLTDIASRLESLARKQLQRQPWTDDEAEFLRSYGEAMAQVMGYFGNSWLTPRDDAPRWVSVLHDQRGDRNLAVGIGRPQTLYLRYPWDGGDILCIGSVMSYYEYWERDRLTDAEWRAKLDSPAAPPPPDWLAPIFAR